jgi:hypothetical protein
MKRAAVAALLLVGCGSTSPPPAAASPARSCDELLADYRATFAARTGRCSSDSDCAMYGGVDPLDVCGGATDVATARALDRIAQARVDAVCGAPGYSCIPIRPHCADGACAP